MINPIKTPLQMLYEQIGITPQHFAKGGPTLTPQQMQALLIIHGRTPPKFAGGGITSKALAAAGPAYLAYTALPEAKETYNAVVNKDPHKAFEHGTNLADLGASIFSTPYWILSSLLGSGELSAGTLDTPETHYGEKPGPTGQLSQYLLNLGSKK
jgi:hypothetical protein